MILILFLIIAYLVGSIPTGYLFCRYVFGIDITKHGSGNPGATNVARTLGQTKYFFLILFIDATKAFFTLYFCSNFFKIKEQSLLYIAIALLVGNAYSVFLKFKGGKGVATTAGILLYIMPMCINIVFAAAWGIFFLITRRVFIASLIAPIVALIALFSHQQKIDESIYFLIFICFWLLIRHKKNLTTIFKGA